MILVTLGTLHFPFDRLLNALGELPADEELVVQTRAPGAEPLPAGARLVAELPYEELAAEIRRARAVVCHAGAGSVLTVLANGTRPVVVPRLARFGEAVDDHQLPFARRLAAAGSVTLVEDVAALPAALAAPGEPPPAFGAGRLAADLRQTLERLVYSR
jgi:UDP-N-acetylglucosamine transferase subunit ALG13